MNFYNGACAHSFRPKLTERISIALIGFRNVVGTHATGLVGVASGNETDSAIEKVYLQRK